ncbi:hypothetical protein ACIQVN_34025 [Streptomyces cyaneofuscatus]|uniref:hypothetical protein n=1 Tax=Streptomyces cyaneofuscatus TaxID=66883 RepID=UPI0037FFD6A6
MRRASYAAEVTVTAGQRFASLGGVTVRNRRLALLWLRRQALRLANGHGSAVRDALPADVRPVRFHGSDAPERLRFWATDGPRQDDAIRALEAGFPLLLTVVDPVVGLSLTLAGWRGCLADHP